MRGFISGRLRSFRFAGRGLIRLWCDEPNVRLHIVAAVVVVSLGAFLHLSWNEWSALALCITLVLVTEAINTAIETIGDRISGESDELIGRAKDVAAAGVLLAAAGSVAVGVCVLGPKLWALITDEAMPQA